MQTIALIAVREGVVQLGSLTKVSLSYLLQLLSPPRIPCIGGLTSFVLRVGGTWQRNEGDGGPELRHSTPQELHLPREHSRRPATAPLVVSLPGEHRRLLRRRRPSELASRRRGAARPTSRVLRGHAIDEQSGVSPLQAPAGGAPAGDAGAHAEALPGSDGSGEGGKRGVWASEWHIGVGW